MGRRVVASVRVTNPDGVTVVVAPGDELPEWAAGQVTNDAVFGGSAADDDGPVTLEAASAADIIPPAAAAADEPDAVTSADSTDDGDESDEYEGLTAKALIALIDERNQGRDNDAMIPAKGNKADLVAALRADDEG